MRKGCFRQKNHTDKAYLVYPPEAENLAFWVPRSVLGHRSQLERPDQVSHPLIQIEVEDWWVQKNLALEKYFS